MPRVSTAIYIFGHRSKNKLSQPGKPNCAREILFFLCGQVSFEDEMQQIAIQIC